MSRIDRPLVIIARWLMLTAVFLVLLGAAGCSQKASDKKLTVVATIFPLADFVKNVAGDKVEVVTLLQPGDSPHTYVEKPSHSKAIARARLLVINGAGLDFWVEKLKSAASDNMVVVDTSVVLEQEGLLLSGDDHEDAADDHGGTNPHFWLDPVLAQKQVGVIASALAEIDPYNQEFYLDNAAKYVSELRSLDEEIRDLTGGFSSREFIAFHASWTYFAKRYDLVEAAVIEEAPGKEPTPDEQRRIVDLARELNVKAIFAEPQFNPQAAKAIANDSGAEVLMLDPLGGPGLKGRDSYVALMRYNVAQMRKAMG